MRLPRRGRGPAIKEKADVTFGIQSANQWQQGLKYIVGLTGMVGNSLARWPSLVQQEQSQTCGFIRGV